MQMLCQHRVSCKSRVLKLKKEHGPGTQDVLVHVGIHGERYFAVGTKLAAAGCSCSCPMFRQMVDSAPENYA